MTDKEVREAFMAINEYECDLECKGCPYHIKYPLVQSPFDGVIGLCIFAAVEQAVDNMEGQE
jgi:hypothetical protein